MSDHNGERLGEALRAALSASFDPSMAAADWLAKDIDSQYESAVDLITDTQVTLKSLQRAKNAFKTMRVVGETGTDRRLAAQLYAATIAAALVRHKQRISTQSDSALRRSLRTLLDHPDTPDDRLRDLAGTALCTLGEDGGAVGSAAG